MDDQQLVQTSPDIMSPIADDSLLYVAQQAERRIEAVKKIKQIALSITNATDWTDQQGKPYIMASGSEKIANLFSISWQIEEPQCETEDDGHYTYTYRGTFSLGGRTIQVEGSRSSKDPFFKKYEYGKDSDGRDTKVEKPISAIDRRDVKMAAMTNLLGNGITRILGIRNLTWEDLRAYAGITQEMVNSKVKYQSRGEPKPPISEPQKKRAPEQQAPLTCTLWIKDVTTKSGETKGGKPWTVYHIIADDPDSTKYGTFSKTLGELAMTALREHLEVKVSYTPGEQGNNITNLELVQE
jgi:hypothetical protein